MSLLPAYKTNKKLRKIWKNQTMLEKRKHTYFAILGLNHGLQIYQNTKNMVFQLLFEL